MRAITYAWAFALAVLFILPVHAATDPAPPVLDHHKIYGRVETALVTDHQLKVRVRMDTGAKTSSLNATHIELFEKEGKKWVRFIVGVNTVDKRYQIEAPLVRQIKIRKRTAELPDGHETPDEKKFDLRPTVHIPVCLGTQEKIIEVSLTDRSHFHYPMLLGRSGMEAFDILIDPSRVFTAKPKCPSSASQESKP